MASDLGVSEGAAGLAVAATAVAGAATAPSIAVILPRTDRRRVLIGLLAGATISDLVVAVAPTFAALMAARLLLGVAIAGYWSFAFGAGTWVRPGRDHVVSTALASGVSVATVIGLPIGSLAGDAVGWRVVFGAAAVASALSAVAVGAKLTAVPAQPSAGLAMLRRALANRRLMAGIAAIMIVVLGNFAAYPYIRVAIEDVAPGRSSLFLLGWGIAGLAGNLAAGGQSFRLRRATATAPVLLAGGLAIATAPTEIVLAVGILLWGFAFNAIPVLTQLWVTRVEPRHAESALSLQVTAFQTAITFGAVLGGWVVDAYDVRTALVLGAGCAIVSGVVFGALRMTEG
jgi:DHA1 family purine ribonucleoside efflux pump-like MFS transporter